MLEIELRVSYGVCYICILFGHRTGEENRSENQENQEQNQLDKYRALIQKQMEKEKAFFSYKKFEFLSRQEAKLGRIRRPLSTRARLGHHLPETTTKAQPKGMAHKNGLLGSRTATRNLMPFIYRQRTRLGMVVAYSKPKSTNSSPAEGRKFCLITLTGSNSPVANSKTHNEKERKSVHFKSEAKGTKFVPRYKNSKPLTIEGPKEIENETLRKRRLALPKWKNPQNEPTKTQEEKVFEDCRNLKKKESKDRVSIDCSRKNDSHSFGKAEATAATKLSRGSANWAEVASLIGLKTKFKRRRLHGTFQAPELEVLDPSLKHDRRFSQAKPDDPWKAVKGCRYLRMPTRDVT